MRPIDADALKEKAFGKRGGLVHASDIDSAPTVEPKHGEWTRSYYFAYADYVCSVCGYHRGYEANFCENCGAKMDGGEWDETD